MNRFSKIVLLFVFIGIVFLNTSVFSFAQTCTQFISPLTDKPVSEAQLKIDAQKACLDIGFSGQDLTDCVDNLVQGADCAPADQSVTNTTKTNNSGIVSAMSNSIPVVGLVIKAVLYFISLLIGGLLYIAGVIVSWILEFNLSILDFNPPFVAVGWTIFRDIANLGFVLGIIIIAVMTILRYREYTAKEILWKLIVAALIVNFSLVIAGAFIQISNTISNYLLYAITGQTAGNVGSSAIAKMGDSFGYIDLVNDTADWGVSDFASLVGIGTGASASLLLAMVITIVFGIIFLFSLIAYGGMLFLRYFWLVFLLMVSPIVWLLWVFPTTKTYFSQWWKNFLHWVYYAPLMLVFTYIALYIMSNYAQYKSTVEAKLGNIADATGKLQFGSMMTGLIAAAMLIGGLKMASKMGYGGTKMVLNGWDKAVNKTKSWAKTRTKWMGARIGDKAIGKKSTIGRNVQKGLVGVAGYQPKSKIMQGIYKWTGAQKAAKFAAGQTAQGLAVAQVKLEKESQKLSQIYGEKLNQLSPDQLIQLLPTLNKNEKTAALNILASKDKLGSLDVISDKSLYRNIILEAMDNMGKIGMGREKGILEKKIGASEDMLRAWSQGRENGRFVKKLTKSDGSPDIDEKTKKQKEEIITFSSAADKFYSKFGKEDYKALAKNYGDIFEKIDKITASQENFLKPLFARIAIADMGTGLGSFSSALKNEEQIKGFYTQLIREIATRLKPEYKIRLDPFINMSKPDGSIAPRKIKQDEFDEIVDILNNSGDPVAKKLANKIKKSISAQLIAGGEDEKEEKKDNSGEKPNSNENKPKS